MEPQFALCFPGRLSDELKSSGVPVHDLGRVRARNLFLVRRARKRLAAILREQSIEIAICHGVWAQMVFGSVMGRAGIRRVFWQHDAATGKGWLEKLAARVRPSLIIANSYYSQSTLYRLYPRVDSTVLFYPVEPLEPGPEATRASVRKELNAPADATVIIQASRLEPWKGHEQHMRALAQLKDIPGWECWIVGGPQRPHEVSYFDHLKRLVKSLGIDHRVRFLGQRHDAARLLVAADIQCQPNIAPQPFGLTFVEGFRSGLPIVTSRLGAAEEIVNDACGVLVRPGDIPQLASVLEWLVLNPAKRIELGVAGPPRAARLCDASRQLKRLADTLMPPICRDVAPDSSVPEYSVPEEVAQP